MKCNGSVVQFNPAALVAIVWRNRPLTAKKISRRAGAFRGKLTLTKLGYLMDIANDLDHFVRAVAVFQTVCQLIKYNRELSVSATIQATQVKFTNGSVIRAVSSDYKGQAGGRQRLTIFDEIWAFDHER